MTARVLRLLGELAAAIRDSAARNFPAECCGLLEGAVAPDGWTVSAVCETANLAEDPTHRFLVDPQAQFDALRRLRNSSARVIGCFHSHPAGRPEPSAVDRAQAFEPDFVWLIAGGTPDTGFVLRAYVYSDGDFFPIGLD